VRGQLRLVVGLCCAIGLALGVASPSSADNPGTIHYPDLSNIIPPTQMSIVVTPTGREFRYTHQIYNGGAGPLEIQPAYNPSSGTYLGTQHIYTHDAAGNWSIAISRPIAGAFVFHAVHGHFHFPLAAFGLYTVAANGGIGVPVALSPKNGFCIADSFILNQSIPHAGAFGNWGSCSDPLSLRGLSVGAADEYDYRDPGQAIPIDGLPDGTYWFRAVVDPLNYLLESDETNNETDVKVTISNNNVQVIQTVNPITSPTTLQMIAPSDGATVSGTTICTASNPVGGTTVQFLLDGQPLGSLIAAPPYILPWDTRTATNGTRWLAAQTADSAGIGGTSEVVSVTVANNGSPTTVTLTDPVNGASVSGSTAVAATASADQGIPVVQFYLDGAPLGAPVSAPPFMTTWNTRTATGGLHTLRATASAPSGVATSQSVVVNVDNSGGPPNPIGVDVQVSRDGQGLLTTPAFSTASPGELLVAFVAYDGPLTGGQTAQVSSAGLIWTLVKRSNIQLGTSEIWSAIAPTALSNATVTAETIGTSGWFGSLTVIAFKNASGVGIAGAQSAPTGPPNVYVPGVSEGNWVFAVGNDWDGAAARTPVAGQVLVHQRVETAVGDTFWVQSTAAASTAPGIVEIRDTAPTNHQWNYAAVEIVATHSGACAPGTDPDGDGVCDPLDNCPSIANADQSDLDSDGVGDVCDNCVEMANPRVDATFLAANPWATLTGGQRDDDHDGYGNKCDAKFPGVPGVTVNTGDLTEFRASLTHSRSADACGTDGNAPCALFDLDEIGALIDTGDLTQFRLLNGQAPGPKCPACPLACTPGTAASCQ